ncbi:tumor necrosis factor receptor superfamily member 3 isoform X2 [Latimeria chalumnae]|uniref:tumor necrosis factor receptor superfamily member 3 isoform X2 n=1 Tax=Latimeria chalumnae TaxID=7897 RepID=UPI00313C6E44
MLKIERKFWCCNIVFLLLVLLLLEGPRLGDCRTVQTSRSVPYEAENGKCRDHNAYLQDTICCQMCPPVLGFVETSPCTRSQKTRCECKAGTVCIGTDCQHCESQNPCPEGTEAIDSGDINQTCSPCPAGTFKNISSAHVKCRTHRNCSASGLKEKLPGTAKSDAKCEESTESFNWKIGLLSVILTLLITAVIGIVATRKKLKEITTNSMVCQKLASRYPGNRNSNLRYNHCDSTVTEPVLNSPEDTASCFNSPVDGESNKTRGQPLNEPPIPDQWGENLLHSSPSSPSHSGFPDHRGENEAENRREVPGVGGNEPHQIQTGSSGIQLMGTNVTIHGNLYIYSQPDSSPPGPSSPSSESGTETTRAETGNDNTSNLSQTGLNYPIKEENCPFLTPQQESGKESHVAVEESGTADRSLHQP